MADCERGLGRPEKALAMAASPEVAKLDAAGTGRDAHRGLRRPPRHGPAGRRRPAAAGPRAAPPAAAKAWSARLFYAYAEALLAAGREDEAVAWFGHAADADETGETDADERLAELAGVTVIEHDTGPEQGDGRPCPPPTTADLRPQVRPVVPSSPDRLRRRPAGGSSAAILVRRGPTPPAGSEEDRS